MSPGQPPEADRQPGAQGARSFLPGVFQLAIIGVGNMGGAMAANLLTRGWPVNVCDRYHARCAALAPLGALAFDNPGDAAVAAHCTIVCVVDAQQTRDVLFGSAGVAGAMKLGGTVFLCPTIAPGDVEDIAARLRPLGLHCVDAPMSGGPARARDGSMSLMVACADFVFERHRLLIETLSSRVFRIGERIGDGARTKLVNNLAAGINLVAAAEVMVMAGRMGLDAQATLEVIEQSSGQSWIGSDRMRRAIAGDYAPRAHMTLLEKDTRLAVQAALDAGFDGPLGGVARNVFAAASAAGLADLDDAALLKYLAGSKT